MSPAVLFVLGDPPKAEVPVSIVSFEGNSVMIGNAPRLPLCAPVKLIEGDRLWLGEVIACHPDGIALIEIQHSVNSLSSLSLLASRFLKPDPVKLEPEPTLS